MSLPPNDQATKVSTIKLFGYRSSPRSDSGTKNIHKSPIMMSSINKSLLISPLMPEDLMGRMASAAKDPFKFSSHMSRFIMHGKSACVTH